MRGPTKEEILNTDPPELRTSSGAIQAYFDMRRKILSGEYAPDQLITSKDINNEYGINTNGIQLLFYRLATEGLIKVSPVRERTRQNNAALSEYRVADLNIRHRIFSSRQGDFVADVSQSGHSAHKKSLALEVTYADEEVAQLLAIQPGDRVIFHRNYQYHNNILIAVSDTYIGFWFVEMLPEIKKPDSDIYELMKTLGKHPKWCTETVDIVQTSSKEREIFELSADDPSPMIKILRRSFDEDGTPLDVQFLTDRADMYRLHYSFPLFAEGVPEKMR